MATGSDVIARAPSVDAPAPDRFETMNLAFHRSLRSEFLAIAKAEPERCAVVDASDTPTRVEDKVWSIVRDRFRL